MNITFHGAAGRVTGSKHLITTDQGERILLDCGLFQGEGRAGDFLNRHIGFDPLSIDCVILSHAHIDHSGLLPMLVKQGFSGPIYANESTADLCRLMLMDSAKIQKTDLERINKRKVARGEPTLELLYDEDDVQRTLSLFQFIRNENWTNIGKETRVYLTPNAHILGSVAITLELRKNGVPVTLTYTGDIGRPGDSILDGPRAFPPSDYIICESTYGDRLHPAAEDSEKALLQLVSETCIENRGKIIIPAFSVDRTQELIYLLDRLAYQKKLPHIDVYVDSPLSVQATHIMGRHREEFNQSILEYISKDGNPFDFPTLHYISKVEDSKKINENEGPCIIISASGMADAGRIKHHIANNIQDARNTILLVGYATPDSLAGRLRDGINPVRIFGEDYPVEARIAHMPYFSAHADYEEMLAYLSCQRTSQVKGIFLVHGDLPALSAWKSRLINKGYKNVHIAEDKQTVEIT
jgi:metallo-beta-lactamase family protein